MSAEDFKTQPEEIVIARKNARKTRMHRKGSGSKKSLKRQNHFNFLKGQ